MAVLLAVAGIVAFYFWARQPPSREEVAADSVFGGELLAYEVWDGSAQVVFRLDGEVRRDQLRPDWISIEWPPLPAWQLTGSWDSIASSSGPASGVGVVPGNPRGVTPGNPTELFGEINSPAIATLEVEYDGGWHAFPVEAPGYLIQLDGFDGVPTGYRWLDAQGNTFHPSDRVEPLEP